MLRAPIAELLCETQGSHLLRVSVTVGNVQSPCIYKWKGCNLHVCFHNMHTWCQCSPCPECQLLLCLPLKSNMQGTKPTVLHVSVARAQQACDSRGELRGRKCRSACHATLMFESPKLLPKPSMSLQPEIIRNWASENLGLSFREFGIWPMILFRPMATWGSLCALKRSKSSARR